MKRLAIPAFILFALSTGLSAARADSKDIGDYIVHYNSLPSVMIPAKVAHSYGITRSQYRGLLNIAVQRKLSSGPPRAVEARIEGQAENLHNQAQVLELREIHEQDAIYYIAEFKISNGEKLQFDIRITPPDGRTRELHFENTFFVD